MIFVGVVLPLTFLFCVWVIKLNWRRVTEGDE